MNCCMVIANIIHTLSILFDYFNSPILWSLASGEVFVNLELNLVCCSSDKGSVSVVDKYLTQKTTVLKDNTKQQLL